MRLFDREGLRGGGGPREDGVAAAPSGREGGCGAALQPVGPTRPHAPRLLFVRTKSNQKIAGTGGSRPPSRGRPLGAPPRRGTYGDWAESLMDWVPRELEILRGSDLGAWHLNNSACRPFKGVEPSTGNALFQIRLNPQKGARTPSCGACQRGTAVCSSRYWHFPENTPKQTQKSREAASTNLDTPDLASSAKQNPK